MDVIGNNIANVNTIGYKAARTVFQDVFCQTAQSGSANQAFNFGMGGTNPIQIGLGVRLSTIDVLHGPAAMQRTDRPLDMMINDDGYFTVGVPNPMHPAPFASVDVLVNGDPDADPPIEPVGDPEEYGFPAGTTWENAPRFTYLYTRAGDFKMDNEGFLVTSHGYYVMGYKVDAYVLIDGEFELYDPEDEDHQDLPIYWRSELTEWMSQDEEDRGPPPVPQAIRIGDEQVGFSVDNDGMINIIEDNRRRSIFQLTLAMFANPEGLEKVGNSLYRESPSSGESNLTIAKNMGAGSVSGGGLEMSNVDLASEFTDMIVTQRGFQANSRIITVSDTMLEELINLKR